MNKETIETGDVVEMIGNLSKDLKSMRTPRLGRVKAVNGAYVLVQPEGKSYAVDFLSNEVRFYKKGDPESESTVKENELTQSVEEAAIRIIQKERGQPFHSEIECFKLGQHWQESKQSAEVERLRKALQFVIDNEHYEYSGTIINSCIQALNAK